MPIPVASTTKRQAWRTEVLATGVALLFTGAAWADGTVTGLVAGAGGGKLAEVWVDAYDTGGARLASGITDTNGLYAVTVTGGVYYLRTDVGSANYVDEWHDNARVEGWSVPSAADLVTIVDGATGAVHFVLDPGGTVSGRVTDALGAAIGDLWVDACDAEGSALKSALTATNGAYAMTGLAPGSYYVRTSGFGATYADEWYDDTPAVGLAVQADALPVSVIVSQITAGVNFALAAGARIGGWVMTAGASPLSNVWVDAYTADGSWVQSTATATNGAYEIAGLPAGQFFLRTFAAGRNFADEWYDDAPVVGFDIPTSATGLTMTNGHSAQNINFFLSGGGVIAGTVTNAAGAPARNIRLDVQATNGVWVATAWTDAFGRYAFAGLPAGAFHVRTLSGASNYVDEWYDHVPAVGSETPAGVLAVEVVLGVTNAGVDFTLSSGGIVAGTVTASGGGPLANVAVRIFNAATNWVKSAASGTAGTYRVVGLPAPAFYLARTADGALSRADEWFSNQPVVGSTVPAGVSWIAATAGVTRAGVDFALEAGATVSGRVTAVAGGAGLGGVAVGVYRADGTRLDEALTDVNGDYAVGALPAGGWYLRTDASGANYVDEWLVDVPAVGAGVPAAARAVALAAGVSTGGVDFALADGGQVAGTVRGTNGVPLAGALVDLYDRATNWVRSGIAGTGGDYVIQGLPAGAYRARSYARDYGYADEWFANVPLIAEGIPVTAAHLALAPGSVTNGVDFDLGLSGVLSGSVRDRAGSALVGVGVDVYVSGGTRVAGGATAADGSYRLSGLAAATYYPRTEVGALGFANEWYADAAVSNGVIPPGAVGVPVTGGAETGAVDFALDYAILSVGVSNAAFWVSWQAASGTIYQVDRSLSLLAGWTNAPSGASPAEGSTRTSLWQRVLRYVDSTTLGSNRFYRVRLVN